MMHELLNISYASLGVNTVLPMVTTVIGALAVLVLDLIKTDLSKRFFVFFVCATLVASLLMLLEITAKQNGFFNTISIDGLAILAQIIIFVASIMFIPLALTSRRFHEFEFAEFYALFLFVVAGFQFMVSSTNLILIFVGLETASLALYTLIAMHNRDRSIEAAIKYFTMGSLAAGFYAFGGAILYLQTGSVDLVKIVPYISQSSENVALTLAGVAFLLAAFGFKLSIVPFHTWTPDVYEGASAPLAGYMSVVPKIAGFVVALRLFGELSNSNIIWLKDMLWIAAICTMTIGNILALVQESVKRMLAFSSISHVGFVMSAILIGTKQAHSAMFLYWALFMFANLGAFTMLWVSRHKSKIFHYRFDHPYTKFSGMIYMSPVAATIMALFMLSLAGIPPFALFWGKFYMISAAINANYILLALIMVLNSAIAVYYYIKLIVYMFLREPSFSSRTIYMYNATASFKAILGISALVSAFSIFFIDYLIKIIDTYLSAPF